MTRQWQEELGVFGAFGHVMDTLQIKCKVCNEAPVASASDHSLHSPLRKVADGTLEGKLSIPLRQAEF
jgi:hypothetical protein